MGEGAGGIEWQVVDEGGLGGSGCGCGYAG